MKEINRYSLIATLALSVAALSACSERPEGDEELGEGGYLETPTVETEPAGRGVDAEDRVVTTASFETMEGAKAGANINGSVSVFESADAGGDYRLAVRIEGLPKGEHAWHIHSAPCGEQGPVVVPFTTTKDGPGLAQPLTPGEDAVAEATVTVPTVKLSLDQLRGGGYSLHVHEKGGVDHGATLACANL